jgi:hypothetical protein
MIEISNYIHVLFFRHTSLSYQIVVVIHLYSHESYGIELSSPIHWADMLQGVSWTSSLQSKSLDQDTKGQKTQQSWICRICRRVPKKKKSVADQFAAVKNRSETYCWTQKLNREDYGVDKVLSFFLSRLRFEISRLRLRFLAGWDLPMTTVLLQSCGTCNDRLTGKFVSTMIDLMWAQQAP